MKIRIPHYRDFKKRHVALLGCIILFILLVSFTVKTINSESNQIHIKKIMSNDVYLNGKFGVVGSYWVKKIGRAFGPIVGESRDIDHYDYYEIYVIGERENGYIDIKLYKNKKDDILKSTISVDREFYEYNSKLDNKPK